MLMDCCGQAGFSKSLNALSVFFGMGLFCFVLFIKVEAWAQKQRTETIIEVTRMEWDSSLYRKTALIVSGDKKN